METRRLLVLFFITFLYPACLLTTRPTPVSLEQGKALIIGNCTFRWSRGAGERKDKMEVVLEEVISGKTFKTETNKEGYYLVANAPPGIYTLSLIRFRYQDLTVEHRPLMRLFIVEGEGIYYLGRFIVEVDTADLRGGEEYPCYEKYVTSDINKDQLIRVLSSSKKAQGWRGREMVMENPLERF